MRKLMWFTLGVMSGIAAGIWLLSGSTLWILATVMTVAGFSLYLLRKELRLPGLIAFGCAVGLLYMFGIEQYRIKPEKALDGTVQNLQITVSDYGVTGKTGTSVEGTFLLNGRKTPVCVYLDEVADLAPSDQLSGAFYLRFTGHSGQYRNTFHQGNIVMLTAYSQGKVHIYHLQYGFPDLSAQGIRKSIKESLDSLFPDDTAGFTIALLLGDSSGLSEQQDNDLQNSGIRHIIAVSGLHVSMLFGLVNVLTGRRKRLCAMLGIPLLFVFAAVAGFTPSVLRACIMQTILLLSYLSKRDYDPFTSLSVAVLIILGINPLALTSISFQLSGLCVLGITLYGGKLYTLLLSAPWLQKLKSHKLWGKVIRGVCLSISVSLCSMLFTLPLSAYYFGIVSVVSILTNLLTLWLITYIFCSLPICCLLGAVYGPLGTLLAKIISLLIRFVLLVSGALADLPYASIGIHNVYLVTWLVFAYAMIMINLALKKKKPLLTASCVCLGLCAALTFTAAEYRNCDYQVTVLDVGHGQCVIVQNAEQCYVVDCGGDSGAATSDLAAHMLKNQGIFEIDGLILTHYDMDHGGGVQAFVSQIQTDVVYLPDVDAQNDLRKELESVLGPKIQWIANTRYFTLDHAMLTVYPPQFDSGENESSMCILFQRENCDILIAGDMTMVAERELMRNVRLPSVDILIVGHHGSNDATSMEFLNVIKPKTAVISVSANNRYGLPGGELLTRLHLYDCRILRTDLHGTIIFRG